MKTVREIEEEIAAKQKQVFTWFAEAKTDDGKYDFSKVTSLKGTAEEKLAEAQRVNAELNDLGKDREEAAKFEKAADEVEQRQKWLNEPVNRPNQPGGKGGDGSQRTPAKSLGRFVTESKEFKAFIESRSAGEKKTFAIEYRDMEDPVAEMKTLFTTAAGWAPESIRTGRVVEEALRPIQVLDIIPSTPTEFAAVVYMEETVTTAAAAERAEGAAYAEADISYAQQSETVRSIGVSLPLTDEVLEDTSGLRSLLDGRLTFLLRQRLDLQVLVGNGTAPNLSGILDRAGLQTQAKGADPVFDAVHKAITLVEHTGYAMASGIVMHPNDWEGVRLTRTADGIYILGNPADPSLTRLWGLPVAISGGETENTGLVGDFRNFCELRPRRGIEVEIGYVADQFKEGERTIRAGLRTAFVVYRPAAFCSVTGI